MHEDSLQLYTIVMTLQSVEMCSQFRCVMTVINTLRAAESTRTESGHVSNASAVKVDFSPK
jgi:hypothetical protein